MIGWKYLRVYPIPLKMHHHNLLGTKKYDEFVAKGEEVSRQV
jgi:hypothetical protein